MTTQPNAGGGSLAQDALGRAGGGASVAVAAKRRKSAGRPIVWSGEKLEALRIAYERPTPKLDAIGHDHGLSASHIVKLALKHGWRTRYPSKRHALTRHRAAHMNAMLVSLACTGSVT